MSTSTTQQDNLDQFCKIYLRRDQTSGDVGSHSDPKVAIYAPSWVKDGLQTLAGKLNGKRFQVLEAYSSSPLQEFTLPSTLTLTELQKISRNEASNVDGVINIGHYSDGGIDDFELLLAMKDLVRQSIIVSRTEATHFGGYPNRSSRKELNPTNPVYIVDLAALQFQQYYNTGRLVLINEVEPIPPSKGLLDDLIFERVVGEKKKTFQEAKNSPDAKIRYVSVRGFGRSKCLFDVHAYHKFVAWDVILAGLAVTHSTGKYGHGDKVNFKFLKYGTGFFAGHFGNIVNSQILTGVVLGLEMLFEKHGDTVSQVIKHIELPFYQSEIECSERLDKIKEKYQVTYSFGMDDALKPTQAGLVTASTNCGDSMAVFGNEMGFSSVDAAIAENLEGKGATLCPILNPEMQNVFLDLDETLIADDADLKNLGDTNPKVEKNSEAMDVGSSESKMSPHL